jgi:hypothetical protein
MATEQALEGYEVRRLAGKRSLNWDMPSEPQREGFVDDMLHER